MFVYYFFTLKTGEDVPFENHIQSHLMNMVFHPCQKQEKTHYLDPATQYYINTDFIPIHMRYIDVSSVLRTPVVPLLMPAMHK